MGFFEQGWSNVPELNECHKSCINAAGSARSLIYLRNYNVDPRPDTDWDKFSREVFNFLALAEEGYTLYKRASFFTKREERDLINETTPMTSNDFNQWLKSHGFSEISTPQTILGASYQAAAYRTLRGALDKLSEIKRVTFKNFMQVDGIPLGNGESKITYWNINLTPDSIWVIMKKARKNLELIYESPREIDEKSLFETGHLFSAAAQFSSPPKVL